VGRAGVGTAGKRSPVPPLPSSPEVMGHPALLPEVDVSSLGPLVSPELVDQTERKYVEKVKVSKQDSACAMGVGPKPWPPCRHLL